jgi:hypothetical protein
MSLNQIREGLNVILRKPTALKNQMTTLSNNIITLEKKLRVNAKQERDALVTKYVEYVDALLLTAENTGM